MEEITETPGLDPHPDACALLGRPSLPQTAHRLLLVGGSRGGIVTSIARNRNISFPRSLEMALAEAGDEIESGSISRFEDRRRPPEVALPIPPSVPPTGQHRRDSQESGLAFQQPRRPECWSWSISRLGPGGVTDRGRKMPAKRAFFMAAGPGFEPELSDSESLVLPLHHPAKYSGAYCNAWSRLRRGV